MSNFNTKDLTKTARLLTTLSLIILNIGIGNLFARQIILRTDTQRNISVKDVQVNIPPVGNITEQNTIESLTPENDKPVITTYVVSSGDTLSTIADKFNISTNTILWANDLTSKSKIKIGQKLTILPITGIEYKVSKGDTISGIVKKFKSDTDELVSFNNLDENHTIKVGQTLIIPDADPTVSQKVKTETVKSKTVIKEAPTPTKKVEADIPSVDTQPTPTTPAPSGADDISTPSTTPEKSIASGYFIHPIPGSQLSQGLHGYNSVDFRAPVGTQVFAAADGTIIIAKGSGYNGGYGSYIVVSHSNGSQTLYAHLSKVTVQVGDVVKQGDNIALSGKTGRVTGPHLHFEVRGGTNPWVGDKVGTQY